MAFSLQYKGYLLRLLSSGRHRVLVQISTNESRKPLVELYCTDGRGLICGVQWIDRELPQLLGAEQNFSRPQITLNVLKAQKLRAEITSRITETQHTVEHAERILARSQSLSTLTRSH